MKEMQNVFIVNPNISKKRKKYIWFRGQDIGSERVMACNLLKFFLNKKIYIDGFVTDIWENVGIRLWNKKIIHINDLEKDYALVFSENEMDEYPMVQSIIKINPLINKKNVVVYGAGGDGCRLLRAAEKMGLHISMFIDSDPEKVAKGMEGIPIYGAEMIDKISEDASIVVAAHSVYQEIDQFIKDHFPTRERFLYNLYFKPKDLYSHIYLREGEIFEIELINLMKKIVQGKKIYVYGISDRSKKLIEIYELLDFNIIGYVDDEKKENQDGRPIISFENAVYKDAFFLLISRWDYRKNFEKLERMKLLMLRDYGFDNPFGVTYVAARDEILDVNLGLSYIGKQGMIGFTIIGNNLPSDTRIVILGSSTTDGEFAPFKSWPEFLARRLEGKNITIYNGGVAGYTTSHELLKLLRDVLYLKPDMVITYDGNMDMAQEIDKKNPFAFLQFGRVNTIMKYFNLYDEVDFDYYPAKRQSLCSGIKPDLNRFDIWLNNIKRMEVVCKYEKIRFISFLAPTLNSKPKKTKEEKGMIWSKWINNDYNEWSYRFRKEIKLATASCNYIYDLSDIFDNENDVYMDGYHVFEKGNEIIADSIYEVVKETFEKI